MPSRSGCPPHSRFRFDKEDKPSVCCGFAKMYLDGMELGEEIKGGYFRYIRGQKNGSIP